MTRLRAPELQGRGWLNTGGASLSLSALRGKIVLLDFWTFCCLNCLHVLSEVRPLEEKYADSLVVVGVHSPKFEHEKDPAAVRAAVERYSVEHAVLDDPELLTWSQYAVRAWPTLVVVDPEGYVVGQMSGEGHAHTLDRLLSELIEEHSVAGTLHRGGGPYVPPQPSPTTLKFPAKAVVLPDGDLLVADARHHSLAQLDRMGENLVRRIGSGSRGLADGTSAAAQFNEPNGLCLLPEDIREQVGFDVVVADTANHALRGIRLSSGRVRTLAGNGAQWRHGDPLPDHSFSNIPLSSPWDVVWHPAWRQVAIAMAGSHQIWSFDPVTSRISTRAGTTQEGLVDGELGNAWFAQPSGLASSADGTTLWLADSETSSLRRIRNGVVHTEVGSGLFDFGFVDGPARMAMFQHPLGLAALTDGSVVVADTYNGAIRRFDPESRTVTTLATELVEPTGVTPLGEYLLIVESGAHRITRIRAPADALPVVGRRGLAHRPKISVSPGGFDVTVEFTPPPGQKLDDRYGPSTHLVVSSSPTELLQEGAGSGVELSRRVVLCKAVPGGVLHVSARAASCDAEQAEFPACYVHQQDWGVPVTISEDGDTSIRLILSEI